MTINWKYLIKCSAPEANKLAPAVVVVVVMKKTTGRGGLATVMMREMVAALFQQGQRERQPEMVEQWKGKAEKGIKFNTNVLNFAHNYCIYRWK